VSAPTNLNAILVFLFLITIPGWSQPIGVKGSSQSIGRQSEYFLDEKRTVSIQDLIQPGRQFPFKKSGDETLNFGPTQSACWVKFLYVNFDTVTHYLAIGNTNLGEVDVFFVKAGKVISSQRAGLTRNSEQRGRDLSLNTWLFALPESRDDEPLIVYVRVFDTRRVIIPLEITTLDEIIHSAHQQDFIFGLYFGCLGIIAVLNLYFFFYLRESIYVFYGGHLFCQFLINGILKGYFFTLLGSSLFFLSSYVPGLAGISNIFIILFTITFLDLRRSMPSWYKPTLALLMLPACNTALNLFGWSTLSAAVGTYVGIIVCIWLFVLGLVAYSRRIMQARFYIFGWGAFFIGILILNSALNQWISVNTFTFNAALYGTLFEVLFISFALADRINLIRLEREEERHHRLSLIEQQNSWLEENVKTRTVELMQKHKEVEAQNEELRQQHEELTSTHELLEKQKLLVEEKNKDIGLINQSLEEKVKQRTVELEETVRNLVSQNNDLEQFSYIVSHNMRAPVARILGLINLLGTNCDHEEREQLMAFMRESTIGLDEIIHDLSHIIDLRRGSDMVVEEVDLAKIIQHNLSDLTDELKKSEARVSVSTQASTVIAVKGYIQSILYNLISNAIKYRDPERHLQITIATHQTASDVVIEIQDTGLGINLPPDRLHEIFHLYKRTYTHVQGKGLGLYLVKTQVEALHGTITVASDFGKGSHFTISFPKQSGA
jgi:two-component system, sensor histidine kinase LadS